MTVRGEVLRRLGELVGPEHVSGDAVFPASPEEVASILALANAERLAVVPTGNSSQQRPGGQHSAGALTVSLRRLSRIKQYEPADLTASLEAGVTLAEFSAATAPHRQWLPLGAPRPELATLGGVVATNTSGPFRLFYGAARDMVIGIRFATAEGKLVKSGGMVVKNVAGYDMTKLLIGSFGTLGIITSVNVRVHPRPATATTALGFATAVAAYEVRSAVLNSAVTPLAMDLLDSAAAAMVAPQEFPRSNYVLAVAYGGVEKVIERARREVEAAGRAAGSEAAVTLAGEPEQRAWRAICDLPAALADGQTVRLKVSSTLDKMPAVAGEVENLRAVGQAALVARAGSGISCIYARGGDSLAFCQRMRQFADSLPAHMVIEFAPPAVMEQINVRGPRRDDYPIMLKLKQAFDPNGILPRQAPGFRL